MIGPSSSRFIGKTKCSGGAPPVSARHTSIQFLSRSKSSLNCVGCPLPLVRRKERETPNAGVIVNIRIEAFSSLEWRHELRTIEFMRSRLWPGREFVAILVHKQLKSRVPRRSLGGVTRIKLKSTLGLRWARPYPSAIGCSCGVDAGRLRYRQAAPLLEWQDRST